MLPLLRVQPSDKLQTRLIRLLSDGAWHHRTWIAFQLHTTIRAVRNAAHECNWPVISSEDGLKLTVCATEDEYLIATGRFRSQMREMSKRLEETEEVWKDRA